MTSGGEFEGLGIARESLLEERVEMVEEGVFKGGRAWIS